MRKGDQGKVKQIVEEYNRLLEKERSSFQSFKQQTVSYSHSHAFIC